MAVNLRAATGELRVGYSVAARLADCRLTPQENGAFTVEATVTESDTFWLEQGPPFALVLHMGANEWRWRDVEKSGNGAGPITVYGAGRPDIRKV